MGGLDDTVVGIVIALVLLVVERVYDILVFRETLLKRLKRW